MFWLTIVNVTVVKLDPQCISREGVDDDPGILDPVARMVFVNPKNAVTNCTLCLCNLGLFPWLLARGLKCPTLVLAALLWWAG